MSTAYLPAVIFHAYMISTRKRLAEGKEERKEQRGKEGKILTGNTSKPIPAYVLPLLTKFHDEMYIHRIGLQEFLQGLYIVLWCWLLVSNCQTV
jgi:hypothetical protein